MPDHAHKPRYTYLTTATPFRFGDEAQRRATLAALIGQATESERSFLFRLITAILARERLKA
jgi:hypothetical protein